MVSRGRNPLKIKLEMFLDPTVDTHSSGICRGTVIECKFVESVHISYCLVRSSPCLRELSESSLWGPG